MFIGGDLNQNSVEPAIDKSVLSPHFDGNQLVQTFLAQAGDSYYEYDLMMWVLSSGKRDKLTDMAYEFHGEHPSTFRNYQTNPRTGEKMYKVDYWVSTKKGAAVGEFRDQSLDYFFVVEPDHATTPQSQRPKIEKFESKVNEFKNPNWKSAENLNHEINNDWQFTSDHYGVENTLTISF